MNGTQAYALALKLVQGLASGFDHATATGDNTFTIFFTDGSSVNLTIPKPLDGEKGDKGDDGLSVTNATINADNHLVLEMSDGTEIDAGELKTSGSLEADLTATVSIGSVSVGKKYTMGTSLESIIRDILIKEVAPGVTLTLNPNKTLYDVVTETVSTIVLTATVTKNTYDPKRVVFYVGDTVVQDKSITGAGQFSFTYTPDTPISANTTFKVMASDGKLSSNATKEIKFVAKSYYGTVDSTVGSPTEAQIKALADNKLKDVKALTYSGITMDFGKVVYAYPQSFGALTSIKDTINNVNYTDSFTRTTATVDGIAYYVYTQTDPSASDDVQIVFA